MKRYGIQAYYVPHGYCGTTKAAGWGVIYTNGVFGTVSYVMPIMWPVKPTQRQMRRLKHIAAVDMRGSI